MKRLLSALIAILVLLSFAACAAPTAAPAETPLVTAAPEATEAPTPEPTAEPTPAPTPEPVFTETSMSETLFSAGKVSVLYDFLGREVVPDRVPGRGPLMGIASALERTKSDLNFVAACDVPRPPLAFAARLAAAADGFEAVLPANPDGRLEPLFACYRKSAAAPARDLLAAGARSILDLLPRLKTRTVPIPPGIEIRNINTRADYDRLRSGGK